MIVHLASLWRSLYVANTWIFEDKLLLTTSTNRGVKESWFLRECTLSLTKLWRGVWYRGLQLVKMESPGNVQTNSIRKVCEQADRYWWYKSMDKNIYKSWYDPTCGEQTRNEWRKDAWSGERKDFTWTILPMWVSPQKFGCSLCNMEWVLCTDGMNHFFSTGVWQSPIRFLNSLCIA